MTKEEIKEYLKENLEVELDGDSDYLRVSLKLEGEEISSDFLNID